MVSKSTLQSLKKDPLAFVGTLAKKAHRELIDELDAYYHEHSKPLVSDEVYDIVRDGYESKYGKLRKVGSSVTEGRKVRLPVPMGSLNKLKPGSQLIAKFVGQGGPFVVSDKEDGISLELVYHNGILQRAFTRGDGVVGKDVSGVIPALRAPQRIPVKASFIVRGEFTADKAVFQKHFSAEFATSRNLGGGLLNRNQPSSHVKRFKFIAYEILEGTNAGAKLSKQLKALKEYGFTVVPFKVFKELDEAELIRLHNHRKGVNGARRDIDGIVVARDIAYNPVVGNPTHAYAFKINSLESSVVVKVKDVVWEESRYGRLVPRVLIEPTVIGGVRVEYFTGHNNYFITHGHIKPKPGKKPPHEPRPINKGAMIRAIRSGDVIPYIMEVVKPARYPSEPQQPYVEDGVHLRVAEDNSDLRRIKELTHFFTTIEVEGLKQGVVTKLVENGLDTVKKILNVKASRLLQIEGFKETSANKLVANLAAAKKNLTFVKVAQGSAVFGDKIGESRLIALEEAIPDLLDRVNLPEGELVELIQSVRGFKQLAVQIAKNLKQFIKFCERNGIALVVREKEQVTGDRMKGEVVLFTSIRDAELQKWIVQNGGKIASTVKQATMLVIKEGASNNKTEFALQNNIPLYTIEQFKRKFKVQ